MLQQDVIAEIVKQTTTAAIAAADRRQASWESYMMIAFVAVCLIIGVVILTCFFFLAKKYMASADARESRMAARIDRSESELSESGSRRESRMASALDASAAAVQQMAEAVKEMATAVKEMRHERRAIDGMFEWLKGRACVATSGVMIDAFKKMVEETAGDRAFAKATEDVAPG